MCQVASHTLTDVQDDPRAVLARDAADRKKKATKKNNFST